MDGFTTTVFENSKGGVNFAPWSSFKGKMAGPDTYMAWVWGTQGEDGTRPIRFKHFPTLDEARGWLLAQ